MVAIERQPERTPRAPSADAIPAGACRRTAVPRQVFAACALGALVLGLLGSGDMPSWVDRLPEGGLTPLVREIVLDWNKGRARLGLTRPRQELHRALERLRALPWP